MKNKELKSLLIDMITRDSSMERIENLETIKKFIDILPMKVFMEDTCFTKANAITMQELIESHIDYIKTKKQQKEG